MPRNIVDGQNLEDAIFALGNEADSPLFGDGDLGDITLNAYLETAGELRYNSLVVGAGGSIGVTAKQKLTIRTVGDLTVDPGQAIHADGRGWSGQNGGNGGSFSTTDLSLTQAIPPGANIPDALRVAGEGGGGGSGGPAFNTQDGWSADGGAAYRSSVGLQEQRNFSDLGAGRVEVVTAVASQDVYQSTIPANTMALPGDYLDVEYIIDIERNPAPAMSLILDWGGTTIVNVPAPLVSTGAPVLRHAYVRGRIYYENQDRQFCAFNTRILRVQSGSSQPVDADVENNTTTLIDTSSSNTLTLTLDTPGAPTLTLTRLVTRVELVSQTDGQVNLGGSGIEPSVGVGSNGSAGRALSATGLAQASSDYAAGARGLILLGSGGGSGGGGAGFASGSPGSGGAQGSVTGVSGFGDGGTGGTADVNKGGGGGAGGAGGGHLVIWCGGNLTVGAGGRISANGGDGGNGGLTGNSGAGNGGGGGGGGGGFVGVFHSGALTNSGTISASGGTGGLGTGGFSQAGGAGGAGAAGIVVTQRVK